MRYKLDWGSLLQDWKQNVEKPKLWAYRNAAFCFQQEIKELAQQFTLDEVWHKENIVSKFKKLAAFISPIREQKFTFNVICHKKNLILKEIIDKKFERKIYRWKIYFSEKRKLIFLKYNKMIFLVQKNLIYL